MHCNGRAYENWGQGWWLHYRKLYDGFSLRTFPSVVAVLLLGQWMEAWQFYRGAEGECFHAQGREGEGGFRDRDGIKLCLCLPLSLSWPSPVARPWAEIRGWLNLHLFIPKELHLQFMPGNNEQASNSQILSAVFFEWNARLLLWIFGLAGSCQETANELGSPFDSIVRVSQWKKKPRSNLGGTRWFFIKKRNRHPNLV
jgi:hypothetical protein